MNRPLVVRGLMGALAVLLAALGIMVALGIAVDAGYFQGPLIRFLEARTGRQIRVEGALQTHLFSRHPQLVAERVTIGNPPWMPQGPTATAGRLTLVFDLPGFGHSFDVARLEMTDATLELLRDAGGHANWQLTDPDEGTGNGLPPVIRSLSMPGIHVVLDDARRHLQFNGTITAQDVNGAAALRPLRIEGTGQLNGRAVTFEIDGEPLAAASRAKPYHFSFSERSSGSRLTGRGFLSKPFDLKVLDATFEATGEDLKDLYFLTGVTLVNTGNYHLTGRVARRGLRTQFDDLAATSGQSDVHATVTAARSGGRPTLDIDLNSRLLRTADLGLRAAGREAETGPPLVLSNTMINPGALRRGDAKVSFHAQRLEVARISLHSVAAKMTIDHGKVLMAPFSADMLGGKLEARVKLDAARDVPAADVDIKMSGLQLGLLDHKDSGEPPYEGVLRARITVTGQGRSIHQVAASANGTVTAVLPHGTIRASLAELAGIDLRGLGLMLTKDKQETGVRCGVASFQAHEGTLTAQSLVVDTDPVLISGNGQIHLDSEALDLVLHGHPKNLRLLRVRSPVLLRGTLAHPSVGLQAGHVAAQAAEAVALGIVLTPLAAVLAFVDPGLAKDADCTALMAAAKSVGQGSH